MKSKSELKHGIPLKQAEALDNSLTEIIKKRIERSSAHQFPMAMPNTISTLKTLEQELSDTTCTNLYIGNLHPRVTEEILFREFSLFGPIESIKIMYPRTAEEKSKEHNFGFVNFFIKADAELAMNALDDIIIFGTAIRIGWGKAIPKNPMSHPLYNCLTINQVAPGLVEVARSLMMNHSLPKIYVQVPPDENVKSIIDMVSRLVSVVSIP